VCAIGSQSGACCSINPLSFRGIWWFCSRMSVTGTPIGRAFCTDLFIGRGPRSSYWAMMVQKTPIVRGTSTWANFDSGPRSQGCPRLLPTLPWPKFCCPPLPSMWNICHHPSTRPNNRQRKTPFAIALSPTHTIIMNCILGEARSKPAPKNLMLCTPKQTIATCIIYGTRQHWRLTWPPSLLPSALYQGN